MKVYSKRDRYELKVDAPKEESRVLRMGKAPLKPLNCYLMC